MRSVVAIACTALLLAQTTAGAQQPSEASTKPASARASAALPAPPDAGRLPVTRVVLYKNGVGFFEHLGKVRGSQLVSIDFTSGQLNDVLKSLTTVDLGHGKVTGVSFNSDDPANRKLGTLSLPLDEDTSTLAFLSALRGSRVEVQGGAGPVTGRVLAVEQRTVGEGQNQTAVRELAIVTDGGELRTFDVTPKLFVRVLDGEVRGDVRRYLDIIASARQRDLRRMNITSTGTGERQLYVSYISEVPVWKSTYRLVLPAKQGDATLLQGWAIVDNTIGEDWTGVDLSLVAGSPQSFIQQLSQPFYTRRPVVPLPSSVQLTPQTHEATLLSEQPAAGPVALAEDAAPAPRRRMAMAGMAGSVPGGVVGGVVGGVPGAPPPPAPPSALAAEAMSRTEAAAQGRELGDLFEYRLKEPVTIRKNQSALVPIINAQVEAERVSVWNASTGQRPRSAVWLTNATPNTLDGGAVAVLEEGTFTGEGLMDPVKPGEKRLLSYAADLALLVDAKQDASDPERVTSLRIARGVIMLKRELREKRTYTIRNEDARTRTVVIEHPNRAGWKLAGAAKPDEASPGVYRFRVQAAPKATSSLVIEEQRTLDTSYQVSNLNDDLLAVLVRQRATTPAMEQALRAVVEKKNEVAAVRDEIADRQRETERIFKDQERLRENLKALKGSAEERSLVTRYTRQLDEQETRLDAIRREAAEREARRAKLQAELDAMVLALTT
jgi:hypothetical protein